MAERPQDVTETFALDLTTLYCTSDTAWMESTQTGETLWLVSGALFAPAVAGTPPTVTVAIKAVFHPIHPPNPPKPPPGPGPHPVPSNAGRGEPSEADSVEGFAEQRSAVPTAQAGITVSTVTITVQGARFPGTQIPADCVLVLTYESGTNAVGDQVSFGGPLSWTQVYGGQSASGSTDTFTGVVTAPWTTTDQTVTQIFGDSLTMTGGVAASMDMAPGFLRMYADAPIATYSSSEAGQVGVFAVDSVQLRPLSDTGLFNGPAPLYGTSFVLVFPDGWILPVSPEHTDVGVISVVAGAIFDTAQVSVGENADGSLVTEATLSLSKLAPQLTWAMPPGIRFMSQQPGSGLNVELLKCEVTISSEAGSGAFQGSLTAGFPVSSSDRLTTGTIGFAPQDTDMGGSCSFTFDSTGGHLVSCYIATAEIFVSLPDAMTETSAVDGSIALVATVPSSPDREGNYPNYVVLGDLSPGAPRAYCSSSLQFQILRTADLACVDLQFVGCGVQQLEGQAGLVLTQPVSMYAALKATLPPQHIAEPGFSAGSAMALPAPARIAGPSTLVLVLPEGFAPQPFSAATLLDWSTATLATARVGNIGSTLLEMPYRVMIAPQGVPGFVNSAAPKDGAIGNPLWHARLGAWQTLPDGSLALSERADVINSGLAVYTPDAPSPQPSPFPGYTEPLLPQDRTDLWTESGDGNGFTIDYLRLSALGASANVHGAFPDDVTQLTGWKQTFGLGRDSYVYAVERGFLFPWGHLASRVSVATRTFTGDGNNTAALLEQEYIVVAQTTRRYDTSTLYGNALPRNAPLQQVDLLTLVTPLLDPTGGALATSTGGNAYWPTYNNGNPVTFHARMYDCDSFAGPGGKAAETDLAAIFILQNAPDSAISAAQAAFNAGGGMTTTAQAEPARTRESTKATRPAATLGEGSLNQAAMGGQSLALAASKVAGDTTHAVSALTMQVADLRASAGAPWNLQQDAAMFCPSLQFATISLPAASLLTSAQNGITSQVAYLESYLQAGGDAFVDAYMQLVDESGNPTTLLANFAGDKANGLVTPSLALSALSRQYGLLVGDVTSLVQGELGDLTKLFPSDAKLLNLIPFSSLLQFAGFTAPQAVRPQDLGLPFPQLPLPNPQIPGLRIANTANGIVATFDWAPSPTPAEGAAPSWNDPTGFFSVSLDGPLDQSIALHSSIAAALNGSPPQTTTTATVNQFTLTIFDLVAIHFSGFSFTAETGKKPIVHLTLDPDTPFTLIGQIDFLEPLLEAISEFFGAGPSLEVDADNITLSFNLAVPSISLGMFNLSGIAVGVTIVLSLSTDPIAFQFNFAGPDNPFDLAIDLLGGGGYFNIDTSSLAQTSITLSGQAGASVSLDLGVASGSISIMLGFTFQSSSAAGALGGGGPQLTGYVRADGELSVLDIISIHASFYLGVTYAPEAGILWGECTISVEVSVLFFHKAISITLRKQFPVKLVLPSLAIANGQGARELAHPADTAVTGVPLDAILSEADWVNYASAFAS